MRARVTYGDTTPHETHKALHSSLLFSGFFYIFSCYSTLSSSFLFVSVPNKKKVGDICSYLPYDVYVCPASSLQYHSRIEKALERNLIRQYTLYDGYLNLMRFVVVFPRFLVRAFQNWTIYTIWRLFHPTVACFLR